MPPLPDRAARSLVQGVGAYIRATPAPELPPKLRRFQKLRPQTLHRHRAALLAVLEDETLRGRIHDWLNEGKPPLARDDEAMLRLAAERPEGWEGELATRWAAPPPPDEAEEPGADVAAQLQRERAKTRRAREEARRAKEEAERARRDAKEAKGRVQAEVVELRRALEAAQRGERNARAEAERAAAALERDRRRLRAATDKAQEERDALRREVRSLRRDVRALEKEISDLRARAAPRPAPRRRKADTRRSRKRTPLPVPKGRLEDAPETLEAWLRAAGVHLLIDEVNKLARRSGATTIVVFDGSKVAPGVGRRPRGPAAVEYSRPEEIADDHLVARLAGLPAAPVVVVTNDKELQDRCRELGATIATSNQLLALIR